jgi:hypothetical protein
MHASWRRVQAEEIVVGPLEMVLAKDQLCAVVEKTFGASHSGLDVASLLRAGNERELEASYKAVGLRMMEAGKREGARELVASWMRLTMPAEPSAGPASGKTQYNLEDDDEEEPEVPSLAKGLGLAMGLGKAFGRPHKSSTTDELAAANTDDHAGAVTEWQGEDELTAMARRMSHGKMVVLELAKAELVAVVKSKLGAKGAKIVEKMERSKTSEALQLAVGEAQRKLVKAGLPRMAAKLAKKWSEFDGRIE